jgi:hypothetical protein
LRNADCGFSADCNPQSAIRNQPEKPIQRPLAATLNHSSNDTSAISLKYNGRTRASSSLSAFLRIVNVNSIANASDAIFTANGAL